MKKNNTISLIDGSGFIFRAYYALPPLTNKDGVPVGAVMGFCNMLFKFLEEKKSQKIVVIFDTARKTFRNDIYPLYKSNRGAPPEDLIPQFDLIRKAVDAFDISRVELAGYEADDLIATYAKKFTSLGWNVSIVSSDKDLMQLVNKNVRMLDPIKNKIIGENEVIEKFGVSPISVIDVQSLAGDSTDNVPGAPGIGIKTASLLINEFGSLENLLLNYDKIKQNKRRETIKDNIEKIKLSKKLVTLKADIDIPINIDEISETKVNNKKLLVFLEENHFSNLKTRLLKNAPIKTIDNQKNYPKKVSYKNILTQEDLTNFIQEVHETGTLSIDTETDTLKAFDAKLVGISLACKIGYAYYIPISHINNDAIKQLKLELIISLLNPILSDKSIIKIGQNIKYDLIVLKKNGFNFIYPCDDTMLMSYTLSAGLHNHNLDFLAKFYLEHQMIKFKDIVGTGKKEINFSEVDIEIAKNYACEDADITLRLWYELKKNLIQKKILRVYENIEKALINVIVNMEMNGIKIKENKLNLLSKSFDSQMHLLQNEIFSITNKEFNINSPKQLGEILFNELNLPGGKKNKSGGFSTNSEVLEKLANDEYKIASLILEWRGISKLKSTYTDSLVKSISDKTKRVHTTFQMSGAQTGRLSSTDPNLQNIPIKTKNGKEIRKSFIPESGFKLVCFDYSQIELRLLAQIANIKPLKNAFLEEEDIHKLTASQILKIPIDEVSEDQRRSAKAINFGIIYGLSAFGLSKQIGVSRTEAKNYIDAYFLQYPGINKYMDDIKEYLNINGYVETLFGRKINITGYQDKNPMIRNYANRQAINAPIQGTAADIIKRAMIKYYSNSYKKIFQNTKLLLQVHDELVFEIKNDDNMETSISNIKNIMITAHEPIVSINIPITVSVGKGDNWEEAH
ncbi:DNA polymerase I [Alphaproteobacteria bacterium]|nr:DNA polymerase I [Alphaproteobacteria bacterium]